VAWPELLGWRRRIAWLFSPVVGNRPCPGDLWGVDEEGSLLLVETKFGRKRQDPFVDFVDFETAPDCSAQLDVQFLFSRWQRLFRLEQNFIMEKLPSLSSDLAAAGTDLGVVPYSYKRFAVRRWRRLYQEVIVPHLLSPRYEETVHMYLDTREATRQRASLYFGLIAVDGSATPTLSSRGRESRAKLIAQTSAERVTLLGATAEHSGPGYVRIRSWQVSPG
jgi:hypothetical protein